MDNISHVVRLGRRECPIRQMDNIPANRFLFQPCSRCCSADSCVSSQSVQGIQKGFCFIAFPCSNVQIANLISIVCPRSKLNETIESFIELSRATLGQFVTIYLHKTCLLIKWKIANVDFT